MSKIVGCLGSEVRFPKAYLVLCLKPNYLEHHDRMQYPSEVAKYLYIPDGIWSQWNFLLMMQ